MLYLVPKMPLPVASSGSSEKEPEAQGFVSDFKETSPRFFSFSAQDLAHGLHCTLRLEIQEILGTGEDAIPEEDDLLPMLICDFAAVDDEMLCEKVFGDEYLRGILMIRFYLDILESLFLFCEDKYVNSLILTIDDHDLGILDIYREFITGKTQVITENGEKTEVVIATDMGAYDQLIDFMEQIDKDFRQTLWRDQRGNPLIRDYLRSHAVPAF